ncbi:hypothetical protein B0H65DRAFT_90415 [Neurospora tetraspora]|uniref:BZIP domain-containing protein n=1 Tax=Neurospora tetraspora TaxID=94610 RepID=A0AAE0JIU7_9PEZI|nr:hypothetical protein B0H65DRAFT_90415 [Neurospora tetraspora]
MTVVASAAPMAGQMTSVIMSIEQQHLQSDMDLSALQQASSSSTTAATFAKRDSPSAVSTPASSAPSPASSCGGSTPASSTSNTATTTTNLTGVPPIAPRPSVAPRPAPIRAASVSSQGAMSPVDCPTPGGGPLSMTSKEWVIPPRPKPGRKPATDTPPTKRKAQNRAAQRAFRERRAARVGELEDQLEEQKEEHDRVVRELQGRISHFEVEVQTLQSRCHWLEDMLEKEKQARNALRNSWDNMSPQSILPQQSNGYTLQQQQQPSQQPQLATKVDSVPIAEPRPTAQPFSISQIISPPEEVPQSPLDVTCGSCQSSGPCACAEELLQSSNVLMGCGGCTPEGRCACLEESIRVLAAADLKRPLPPSSPSLGPDEKRQRSDAGVEDVQLETDFTALFSSKKPETTIESITPLPAPVQQQSQQQSQPMTSVEMHESCGFCKDGTYCVCAESMALSAASMTVASVVQQVQMHTPPPSENDVVPMPMEVTATGAVKLPSFGSLNRASNSDQPKPPVKTGGCGPGGPGTCAQCLADPKSGLFCRSLAANFERNRQQTDSSSSAAPPSGCCGGGGPGGGCCKTEKSDDDDVVPINLNRHKTTNQLPAPTPFNPSSSSNNVAASNSALSISCADAYKTIASHRHFEEAADDIGSWLPKLRAVPANPPPNRGSVSMRQSSTGKAWAPIEVEAASIMAVLKGFDVRFGRGE